MVETRKTVTIVCCDVVRSTSPGERLDPEVVRGVMSRCSAAMRSVLERHGGSVEEFMGEAVMAVFGVPVAHEDDALRAVRATTEIRAGLAALNDELVHEHGVTVAARSGVTTGEVLVGGDRAGGASLAAGEAVNVAARLQQSAAPGEILIGEGTYRLVGHAVRAESLVPAALEGDSGRAGVWRLGDLLATAPVAVPASPFVGRQHELAALRDAFDRAVVEQRCRLVTVIAPAGTGKSRLAGELVAAVGARARALRGRCLSYGEGITYWPLAEIVSQIGGSEPGQLMALLQPDPQAEFLAQRIAGAVGLSSIETRTEEVLWAVRRLLEALARERPLVVVFDDIHWAEPTFLDLVEYLAAFAAAPILLLCLARPVDRTRELLNDVDKELSLSPR